MCILLKALSIILLRWSVSKVDSCHLFRDIPALTFHHSNFEEVIPLKGINLLAIVVCCLSVHICTNSYWLHMENMSSSDCLKHKVTPYWLTQKHGSFWLIEIQSDSSLADTIIWQLLICWISKWLLIGWHNFLVVKDQC